MNSNPTLFEIAMDNFLLQFQPDCGSDVTLISENDFANFQHHNSSNITLSETQTNFTAANNTQMNFIGFFHTTLCTKSGKSCEAKVFVADIPDSDPPLIGEKHLLNLGLITYHPNGSNVRKIAQINTCNGEHLSMIKVELNDPTEQDLFKNLHKRFSSVFTGMGLLIQSLVILGK